MTHYGQIANVFQTPQSEAARPEAFKMLFVCDPIVSGEDPECLACLSDLPGVYFDSRQERVTLCRAHLLQLVDRRVRS